MRLAGALVLFFSFIPISYAAERAKIGLVLEGGGALGFAHIGVLQWFEANRIPIDAIAGTSMGGLVGGLYSAGETPTEIQTMVGGLDWDEILRAQPPFTEIGFRRKEDRIAFPNLLEFGWRKGLALPSGLNSGQAVDSILDRTLLPYFDMKSFDDLPIPFRCVATDLVSGKEKDFDRGSLAAALRATISIPALFIPEDRQGAVYTDGGSVNNLPVDVAKKMNVDIVIAVYLDGGPPAGDFQRSLVGIAARTASIMVAANEMHSIQLADILLTADVKEFSIGDFTRSAEIIPRGYEAAQRKQALLGRFSVAEDEWQSYLAVRRSRRRTTTPVPEYVAVTGATPLEANSIERSLATQIGKPIDTAALENKLTNLNAQGAFDSLRYGVVEEAGKPGLGIFAAQKTNGPPFVNFGLIIDGSDTNDVRFGVAARLTLLNVGGFRSEWRTGVAVGDHYEIGSEYYHPFSGSSNWFLAPHAYAGKRRFDLYDNRNRTAEYSIHRAGIGLDLGYVIGEKAEIRIGEELARHEVDLKLGSPPTPNYARTWGDSSARWQYFGQDATVIPSKGLNSQARIDWFSAGPFGGSYHSAETKSSLFVPVSANGSVWVTGGAGSAFGAKNLGLESFTLGGPFRLGAYGIHELIGNQYMLFQGGYSQRIATFNPLFGGAVYGLGWFETGKMYGDAAGGGWPMDGSIAIVTKTALGPIFAGASMAATDRVKWWFGLGHVF
jgi:NTE family protein